VTSPADGEFESFTQSSSDVTREGLRGTRPDREALTGVATGRRGRRRGKNTDGQPTVPKAEFSSYYGMPVLNQPTWEAPDIAGYFFLGGLAGASSLLAAGAQVTGRDRLATASKLGGAVAGLGSLGLLIHDLGRPSRFLNMLRVIKVTSPLSVGTWLLSPYVGLAVGSAASAVTRTLPRVGSLATGGAALLGPAVASYTAALLSDTAVPAWHDGYREMPVLFTGSAATAAGGLGLLAAPPAETGPARALGLLGTATEGLATEWMKHRLGMVGEPYSTGKGGRYMKAATALSVAGAAGALLGCRNRVVSAGAGLAWLAGSAASRFGVFHAGLDSAADPRYTVEPQRERLRRGEPARSDR
jgi:hypothetical protein